MDEQRIKEIVQQVIDENATSNQFAVSDTPFHTHNGADSQSLKFTRLFDVPNSYFGQAGKVATVNTTENALIFSAVSTGHAGYVNADGSAGNLPTGWTSSKTGTGQYTVTHNLGTANYSAIAMAYAFSGFCKFNAVNANDVQFVFLDSGGSLGDSTFYFILLLF